MRAALIARLASDSSLNRQRGHAPEGVFSESSSESSEAATIMSLK
jgi:hypothetical protein